MASQKGLGKGLGALFGESAEVQQEPLRLPIQKIEPNPDQPRKRFDPEELQTLADSIAAHGLIQPLAVRLNENGYYQIIAGERRWRAARLAGLTEVPAIVLEADDRTVMELALIENLQRSDLNPIEEALGYRALMEEYGLTQEQTAEQVGKSRPAVANALRLLALPDAILEMVESGKLTAGHAPGGSESQVGETAEDSRSEDCGAGALRAAGGTHVQTHGAGTGPRDGEAVEGGLSGRL